MAQEIETLLEMGFSRERAERALAVTNNKGVEPAMEWLLAHADEPDPTPSMEAAVPTPPQPTTSSEPAATSSEPAATSSEPAASSTADDTVAKSIKCEDCGKLFTSQTEMEFHAAKSGHINFCESSEEKKPLSEEEKKELLVKLEERMKQKRKEREEKERAEQLEKERLRIKSGKDMQDARLRLQEQEMQKLVEQRRRDKMEERQARDKVRAQIEADKEARRLVAQGKTGEEAVPAPPPAPAPAPVPTSTAPKVVPTSARLQLRLPDGRALTQTFGAREQLSAVRLYLQINEMKDRPFGLMTTFPKRVFSDEDYDKPLDVLGLAPSAVVIVSKLQTT